MAREASVHGAITVVNAIPAGRGAAIGIDLETTARVELTDGPVEVDATGPEGRVDDRLVRAVAGRILPDGRGARIRVESTVPVGRGLKSSSACANAVAFALDDALGRDRPVLGTIRAGARAAVEAGVSTTGAFDDACASALGGICVTDNEEDRLLARFRVPDLDIVLGIPEPRKAERSTDPATYADRRRLFEVAHRHAVGGSWQAAFALNATGVADALGLDTDPIMDALARGSALAGPSGTGPAHAALCPSDRRDRVEEVFAEQGWEVRTVRPVGEGVR